MAVKKAEFARILNVSKARVSQYVQAGLPVLPDGTIDIDHGRAWIRANIDPGKRSDWAFRRAVKVSAEPPAQPMRQGGETPECLPELLPRLIRHALGSLPNVVAMAVADEDGTRPLAERIMRIVVECMHDELVEACERMGQGPAISVAWRSQLQSLVRSAPSSVPWHQLFGADGRSICPGEIYGAAGD